MQLRKSISACKSDELSDVKFSAAANA